MRGRGINMRHLDLFSGIGGFALAAQTVWGEEYENIGFCDNDKFCQQVLKKHWPNSPIYDDIRTLTNASSARRQQESGSSLGDEGSHEGWLKKNNNQSTSYDQSARSADLITGGFPCQPFSAAGRRKGTADDRHLWPEMFRVIREFAPLWVVAENVRGLATWNDGMVLEQVCADLESEGYQVQPFIIPAVALNAPHRRDRIWFVAHRTGDRRERKKKLRTWLQNFIGNNREQKSWSNEWLEVAAELCRVDDGLPAELDGLKLSKSAHRKERLKSLGNAIVPQVAMEIFKTIKSLTNPGPRP